MRVLLKGFRGVDFELLKVEYFFMELETTVCCGVKGFERGFCGLPSNLVLNGSFSVSGCIFFLNSVHSRSFSISCCTVFRRS